METTQRITRIPPNNVDSERALLGSIILNDNIFEDISKKISAVSFYNENHKIIYSAMLALRNAEQVIDLVTLCNQLETMGKLSEVGGSYYLTELVNLVPSSANAEHYANIVQSKYARRQMIQLAEKMALKCYEEDTELGELLVRSEKAIKEVQKINTGELSKTGDVGIDLEIERLRQEIDRTKDPEKKAEQMSRLDDMLKTYSGDDKMISSHDLIDQIKNEKPTPKILTTFSALDGLVEGFRPGQLVSLSAVAKSGKTNFCMELTSKQREFNPVWFPFEEGAKELISKFLDRGEMPPIFFIPQNTNLRTLRFIELKILEAKSKFNSQIFYIDNLDWIVDPRSQDHERMIQYACMELKRIAVQLEVCIVLIAHVRKLLSPTDQPNYNDIKGSSSVYQLSDTVIMMWRETKKENGELIITNNVNVSVQLNRKTGKTGNIKFAFENGHYREYDWQNKDKELEEAFNF